MADPEKNEQEEFFLQELLGKKIALMEESAAKQKEQQVFFLNDLIGVRVKLKGKRLGKLQDLIVVEYTKIPEVATLIVHRPFGYPALLVPWERVVAITQKEIEIELENIEQYESEPAESAVLLADHILDKKVLDIEGREVEVVYDIKLVLKNKKLYVSDVDFSKYGFLRRIGMRGFATFVYGLADSIKRDTTSWAYVQPLSNELSSFKGEVRLRVLKEKLADMPPVDLADILEALDHEQRVMLFNELEPEHASDTLEEIEPNVQRELVASLKKEKVAHLVSEMTPGQAADVLAVLPSADANAILALLKPDAAKKVRAILARDEELVANFITKSFLKFPPEMTVATAKAEYQREAKGKAASMYLYIVAEDDRLLGVVDVKELLLASDEAQLKDIMTENIISLKRGGSLLEASELFERYGFRALPITGDDEKIIGVIPYRDVMELTHSFME